mmetsp:Transcript_39685/g.52006  ORF Transcript_39685/g.52006 Transcript_39685/m.52006 type:complete len:85 (-) Transcript_39685:1069-1323(-)
MLAHLFFVEHRSTLATAVNRAAMLLYRLATWLKGLLLANLSGDERVLIVVEDFIRVQVVLVHLLLHVGHVADAVQGLLVLDLRG